VATDVGNEDRGGEQLLHSVRQVFSKGVNESKCMTMQTLSLTHGRIDALLSLHELATSTGTICHCSAVWCSSLAEDQHYGGHELVQENERQQLPTWYQAWYGLPNIPMGLTMTAVTAGSTLSESSLQAAQHSLSLLEKSTSLRI
jgi:hypothetical protein